MSNQLAKKFVLSIKPKEYLTQGPNHCGVYSVKAVLSAFGLDFKGHPKEYHPNVFGRLTGLTLSKQYLVDILKSNGLNAKVSSAENLSSEAKLDLLKTNLAEDKPVMVRIGNGYILTNKYNPVLGKIIGHWITLWGYDDQNQIFYVYDSGLLRKYWNKTIPIGNTTRTYQEVLRDWDFGRFQPWYWFITSENNTYIKILPNKKGIL